MLNLTEEMKQELIEAGWIAPPEKKSWIGDLSIKGEHILINDCYLYRVIKPFYNSIKSKKVRVTIEEVRL
jgi:hypothetical protein